MDYWQRSEIFHVFRVEFEITVVGCMVLDFVHKTQGYRSPIPGYCSYSDKDIAEYLGCSRRTVVETLTIAQTKGLVERKEGFPQFKRCTDEYISRAFFESKQSAQGAQNFHTPNTSQPAQNLHRGSAKIAHRPAQNLRTIEDNSNSKDEDKISLSLSARDDESISVEILEADAVNEKEKSSSQVARGPSPDEDRRQFIYVGVKQIFEDELLEYITSNIPLQLESYQRNFPLVKLERVIDLLLTDRSRETFREFSHLRNTMNKYYRDIQASEERKASRPGRTNAQAETKDGALFICRVSGKFIKNDRLYDADGKQIAPTTKSKEIVSAMRWIETKANIDQITKEQAFVLYQDQRTKENLPVLIFEL